MQNMDWVMWKTEFWLWQNEPTIESFVNYYVEAQGPEYDQEQLRWIVRDMIVGATDTTASFLR